MSSDQHTRTHAADEEWAYRLAEILTRLETRRIVSCVGLCYLEIQRRQDVLDTITPESERGSSKPGFR